MTFRSAPQPFVAIACGGTGGHVFPGVAVAEHLMERGCAILLIVSPKAVDQQAVKAALERQRKQRRRSSEAPANGPEHEPGMEIFTLPAVALQRGNWLAFARGGWESWRAARRLFQARAPHAALAMGGFTSAPPILAAKAVRAKTFLHESNVVPGRANRWLARFVDQAFVGFAPAAPRLRARHVTVTGTPVRPEFQPRDPAACRAALGLDPARPMVLVTGGSQGARGLNDAVLAALPLLAQQVPPVQWLHLTGAGDFEKVRQAYAALGLKAVVHPFLSEMDRALGAATVALARAGASSLAEIAAMRVPAVLVPFPSAADNHQLHNAQAFEQSGAARVLEQKDARPERTAELVSGLIASEAARRDMQLALAQWHTPQAAEQIASKIFKSLADLEGRNGQRNRASERRGSARGNESLSRAAAPARASVAAQPGSMEGGRI